MSCCLYKQHFLTITALKHSIWGATETEQSSFLIILTELTRNVKVHSLLPRRMSAPSEAAVGVDERPDDSTEGPGGIGGANIPCEEWGTTEWGCVCGGWGGNGGGGVQSPGRGGVNGEGKRAGADGVCDCTATPTGH